MASDTFKTLTYETDGRVATITLNRPERMNAIVFAGFLALGALFAPLLSLPLFSMVEMLFPRAALIKRTI